MGFSRLTNHCEHGAVYYGRRHTLLLRRPLLRNAHGYGSNKRAGCLKSDFRYSASLVYNNYPWPEAPSAKQRAGRRKSRRAKGAGTRAKHFLTQRWPTCTTRSRCPPALMKAHTDLDRAVDLCYRSAALRERPPARGTPLRALRKTDDPPDCFHQKRTTKTPLKIRLPWFRSSFFHRQARAS